MPYKKDRPCVYGIYCKGNSKLYIGSSIRAKNRLAIHKSLLIKKHIKNRRKLMIDVGIMLTHSEAKAPVYKHDGDAGADVYCVSNPEHIDGLWLIKPGSVIMIDLGFKMDIPDGYEIQVRSRSGLSKKGLIVANSPGTIDSGYKGPCKVLMSNITRNATFVEPGERIA